MVLSFSEQRRDRTARSGTEESPPVPGLVLAAADFGLRAVRLFAAAEILLGAHPAMGQCPDQTADRNVRRRRVRQVGAVGRRMETVCSRVSCNR